ncbi:MAG: replication factor C small subunit [Candidatus Thermoplasmatota archaeon]|nr:replication factor C small subunit [Candidatus Thermoplasmatota archaeon]
MHEIWIEKYRPETLDDIVGQTKVAERLKAYVKRKNVPHMLFAGPAGTGKTSCAIALARELFGENFANNFIELNASDERGIDIIRGKIKDFARTMPLGGFTIKIIFLDEADALTNDAQSALRRTMEMYANNCRFILSCNYSSRIIEPIQSRCVVFRFSPLSDDDVKELLKRVAEKEGLSINEDALDAICYISQGDLRRALNVLQVAATMTNEIDSNAIYVSSSTARPEEVKEMVDHALNGEFIKSRNTLDSLLIEYGMSGGDVVYQIYRVLLDLNVEPGKKVKLIDALGEADFRLTEGSNERIQLESMLAKLSLIGK